MGLSPCQQGASFFPAYVYARARAKMNTHSFEQEKSVVREMGKNANLIRVRIIVNLLVLKVWKGLVYSVSLRSTNDSQTLTPSAFAFQFFLHR